MKFILFAQTLIGIWFVVRTLQIFRARAIIKSSTVINIGTLFVCKIVFIAFFCANYVVSCFILIFLALSSHFLILFIIEHIQILKLKSEFPIFLDRWLLNIKLGHAIAHACELTLRFHSKSFRTLIRPIFSLEETSKAADQHILVSNFIVDELRRSHAEPHFARTRLESLRATLRRNSNFRRKSGQAVRQAQIQAMMMVLMLLALIIFTIYRYGFHKISDLVLISVGLSLIGTFLMFKLARKTKWKV